MVIEEEESRMQFKIFRRFAAAAIWILIPACLIVIGSDVVPSLDFASQADPDRAVTLDQNPVYNVAWNQRESRVLIRTRQEVVLLDRDSGQTTRLCSDPQRQIVTTALSPEGNEVAISRISENTVKLYDVRSPESIEGKRNLATGQPVTSVVYTPDGKHIITAAQEGRDGVCVWDRNSGGLLRRLKTEKLIVRRVACSKCGRLLLGITNSKRILVWNDAGSRPVRSVRLPAASHAAQFVGDDSLLCGDIHGNLFRWKISTDRMTWRRQIRGFYLLNGIAVSPDRKTAVISGASDAELALIDIRDGRKIGELAGHRQTARLLQFSKDAHTLYSAGSDGTVRSWDWRQRVEMDRVY